MQTSTMTTVAQQAETFLSRLSQRRRNPVKPATQKAYASYLRTWIVPELGDKELATIENGVLKAFASKLVEKRLAPSSVNAILTTLKILVKSEIDANGNVLNPRSWNSDYIDAPRVVQGAQKAPIITSEGLNKALRRADGQFASYYALQAGSGLRMSEMLALRRGPDDGISSIWDPETAVLYVRRAIYDREEQSTKTLVGVREVDLSQELNDWLLPRLVRSAGEYLFQTTIGTLLHVSTIYDNLEHDRVPGTHSLRRFRATHLEGCGTPPGLMKYWIGHSSSGDVTARYVKVGRDLDLRRRWADKVGLGFSLPRPKETI